MKNTKGKGIMATQNVTSGKDKKNGGKSVESAPEASALDSNGTRKGDVLFEPYLDEIEFDFDWNSRSKASVYGTGKLIKEAGGKTGEASTLGLPGLARSISIDGQDTPILIRANAYGAAKPYKAVCGFRRGAAMLMIATEKTENGDYVYTASPEWRKRPTVKAVLREMTEHEARALNMRENVDREDLSGPDLAWGVQQMIVNAKAEKKAGDETLTQGKIGQSLGISQNYVSRLAKIMACVNPDITAHWRGAAKQLTILQMMSLTEIPSIDQRAAYEKMCTPPEGGDKDPNAWIEKAKKDGAEIGKLLGSLSANGFDLNAPVFAEVLELLVKVKKDSTPLERRPILNAIANAYFGEKRLAQEQEAATAEAEKKAASDA